MEEDIKVLEEMLKARKEQKEIIECAGGYCGNCKPDIKALEKAIKTMKSYSKLEEENKRIKDKIKKKKRYYEECDELIATSSDNYSDGTVIKRFIDEFSELLRDDK